MKQQTVNQFSDGLNLDLHPLVTPKTVLTDNLNGTFITYNGNEFCLQNDRGNKEVSKLTDGYTPIGIKEHNGILYIVSVKNEGTTLEPDWRTEIGTFPSPDYTIYNEIEEDYDNNNIFSKDKYNERVFGKDAKWYLFDDTNEHRAEYRPLHVLVNRTSFTGQSIGYNTKTPVTIEVQDSYDGSVNLILVADGVKTRIINSGFSILPNNQYKFVDRNQSVETNIYNDVDKETELIRTSNIITNIDLLGVQSGGQFKGGNYTFYIKFGDADYNQTDVVAESGIVSIFNGNDGVPSTISGTLLDERTNKMIHLEVQGLNHVYSKIYIYYSREYSDTQGFRMTEYGMFKEPIDMNNSGSSQDIWLTGLEQTVSIESELLNVDYHTVDWARAETQHSNMLFLGNVGQEETFQLYYNLKEFTKAHVHIFAKQDYLDPVELDYTGGTEYYNTQNIYNKLGYWPDEIYRFGIVYILEDGSTTPVFNIKGGFFKQNLTNPNDVFYELIQDPQDISHQTNDFGVVLTPSVDIIKVVVDEEQIINGQLTPTITHNEIWPLYFNFTIDSLPDRTIGWFVVRQKRIPRTVCQGLSIGIDEKSHLPLLQDESGNWNIESFLSYPRNVVVDDSVLDKINNLENRTAKWRYWLYGALYATLLPGLMNIARLGFLDSVVAKNELYKLYKEYEQGPLLEYLQKENISSDLEDVNYIALRISNYISKGLYNDFETTYPTYFTDNIVDRTKYDNIHYWNNALHDTVYDCTYQVYKVTRTLEDDNSYSWDVTTNNMPIVHYLNNENTSFPSTLDFSYQDEIFTIVAVEEPDVLDTNATTESYLADLVEEFCYPQSIEDENIIKRLIIEKIDAINAYGLLSLDPCVNSTISGMLDGSRFELIPQYNTVAENDDKVSHASRMYNYKIVSTSNESSKERKCIYIKPHTNIKMINEGNVSYGFSNIAGSATEVSQYKSVHDPFNVVRTGTNNNYSYHTVTKDSEYINDTWKINNINIVRGEYCPYIGVATRQLIGSTIYSIRLLEKSSIKDIMLVREQDNSEYYCVSKRTNSISSNVFRGDCYTNTVSIRINRNFIDPVAPVAEQIVDKETWAKNVLLKKNDFETALSQEVNNRPKTVKEVLWDQVNLTDVNTVDLGMWATFKCLSSYNLGLRSKDTFHTDEMALLGSPRSFYPLNSASTATGNKMEESWLLNDGLSATVGRKRYNLMPDVPYSKSEFANRIMFSNVNVTDAFTNGYRTFQGLSYKDYDKQYGAITKLISLGQNIFVVMEHGLGLVPVNPKALMQTTTGEAIHIYGYGVLPDEMTIISQDYGSKYEHSVVRTPIGIYGIDVDAKKIWRFSDKQGFETISDMKIETYLKDSLQLIPIELGETDIRTHYNGKKGDLMFTWNDKSGNSLYSICYNERQNLWTTRYDWKPIVSENINDEFYSLNFGNNPGESYLQNQCVIWDHIDDVGYDGSHVSSWYDNNRGFEFEFVVSDPIGVNKIYDNLQIISNNVQPQEMEITIIGDDYEFKRDYFDSQFNPLGPTRANRLEVQTNDLTNIRTTSNIHGDEVSSPTTYKQPNSVTPSLWTYKFDKRLNQSALVKWQPFKDIYKFGRRIGNIQYKEGSWYTQIEPLLINARKEARIRDKWAKIRIRYSGKDLAVITAIKTLINI